MYRHIMLIRISRGLLNLICNMIKALNDRNSSQQNSQTPSPPFNAILKTLLQLFLVLTLINLLIAYQPFYWMSLPTKKLSPSPFLHVLPHLSLDYRLHIGKKHF